MKVIVCLDDNGGMLFNKRRQSQDCAVKEDILKNLQGAQLWLNGYSFRQFAGEETEHFYEDENFMEQAGEEAYCFVEDQPLIPYEGRIRELIIYRWNRKYPADRWLDLELKNWELISTAEFPGNSHEKITKEIYQPKHLG